MRYFIDTEFAERPCTIDIISLAIVAEDGRELYLVSSEFHEPTCNAWVRANVLPNVHLDPCPCPGPMDRALMGDAVREFIGDDAKPEFWGYYADYDWVAFCWLFGAMIELPKGWPMYCRDLKQLADDIGARMPHKNDTHNALRDARDIASNFLWLCDQLRTRAAVEPTPSPAAEDGP